jgi:YfiH family protein
VTLFYTQRGFAEQSSVFHGFFTRKGGLSSGLFATLNCGPGSGDDLNVVRQNRAIVAREAGIDERHLLSVHQIHGADCMLAEATWPLEERPKADAMVTDVPGFGLGILTADCAPVLFHGAKEDGSPVIGAAHAGWKGALGGVFKQTIKSMGALGARVEDIKACVGPCIARNSYEVDASFIEPFLEEHDESSRFFQEGRRDGHLMFDLPGYCAWRLFRDGVRSIALMDKDTYVLEDDFYSYRRATHRTETDYGRQISVIAIRNG